MRCPCHEHGPFLGVLYHGKDQRKGRDSDWSWSSWVRNSCHAHGPFLGVLDHDKDQTSFKNFGEKARVE